MTGVSLDSRERVTLFIESDLSIDYVLGLPLIHYDLVREHCASTDHIRAANLSVTKLRRMGASTPDALKALGFDMYDLRNESWCVQLVNECCSNGAGFRCRFEDCSAASSNCCDETVVRNCSWEVPWPSYEY